MNKLWRQRCRSTNWWLAAALGTLLGIGLAKIGFRPLKSELIALCVVCIATYHWRWRLLLPIVLLLGICLGGYQGHRAYVQLQSYHAYYGHTVTLLVTAREDAVYGKQTQLTFAAGDIRTTDGQRLTGQLSVAGFGASAIFQGDTVRVSGKLYPGFGTYQANLSYAQLQIVSRHGLIIATIRRDFAAGMQTALPEPLASFAMGLLIGQRANLPANVKQDLLVVGLTHIIAVSGYNLTIMLRASRNLLAGRSKRLATALSFGLIGGFLLLAGSSASIVRAAIVSVLSIWASYYGRQFRPLNLILLTAAGTALLSPFYEWGDMSWYLSFLAFYGVLAMAPLIANRLPQWWHRSVVWGVLLESFCAELMTVPIILFVFGQISFIGLPANVLVVALIPLAMLLSAVAGLAGMLTLSVAGWLSWPARLLLTYMLDVAHLLSKIPHSFIQHLHLSLWQMLFLYSLIAGFNFSLWFKSKSKSATITDDVH